MARKNRNALRVGRKQVHHAGCQCRYCRAKTSTRSYAPRTRDGSRAEGKGSRPRAGSTAAK